MHGSNLKACPNCTLIADRLLERIRNKRVEELKPVGSRIPMDLCFFAIAP